MNYPCGMNQKNLPLPVNRPIKDWLATASRKLKPASESPFLEAQMLAAFVLQKPRSWLFAHLETSIDEAALQIMDQHLIKMAQGYPFAYICGEREFFGHVFEIHPGILVPRPETEMLVEVALEWLKLRPDCRQVLDIGCGSGCIAVSLAAEISDLVVTAIDIDPAAVALTNHNANKHQVGSRVNSVNGDLMDQISGEFDLICANLPYIPSGTLKDLVITRYEPILALDGGPDGLRLIEKLLYQADNHLSPGGLILLEIESTRGKLAFEMASAVYPDANIEVLTDLAGHPRLLSIQT